MSQISLRNHNNEVLVPDVFPVGRIIPAMVTSFGPC